MTSLLEWLLDLERIRLGEDAPLLLRWGNPIEAWMLFCFGLVAATWVAMAYRQESTSTPRRAALAVLRCVIVALLAAVLCQPVLVLQRNRVEPSHVALAVDTSQSMGWKDVYEDSDLARAVRAGAGLDSSTNETGAQRQELPSRLELVQRSLLQDDAAALRHLLSKNGIQLVSFDGGAQTHGLYWRRDDSYPGELNTALRALAAEGTTTDIGGAIREIIHMSEGRRLAAIVLASDGRSTHAATLKNALDLAAGRQIPIFPLRIGSPRRPQDVELSLVKAPETVFVGDLLVVQAALTASGLTEPVEAELRLRDVATDEIVAREDVTFQPGATGEGTRGEVMVALKYKPTRTGTAEFRIEVPPLPHEWVTENNADRFEVAVIEDEVRVLYVEGYPRYEYRYLKNALLRESTVELSVLLLHADEQFVQEGTTPIRRFPQTTDELNRFEVVLFGDVDPAGGWINDAQLDLLVDFVDRRGGGFGLIAGEHAAPHRYADTPLEKLIPVQIDATFTGRYDGPLDAGFRMQLTAEGRGSRVFQLAEGAEPGAGNVLERLPELYWVVRTLGPKPGATVLAEHPTRQTFGSYYGSRPLLLPIVVTGRYGAGKLFFQATDDTWRWRRGTGEFLHDAYWVQVVRELMPDARTGRDRRLVVRTDQRGYDFASPVRVQVEFFDAELLAEHGDRLSITPEELQEPAAVELQPFELERLTPGAHRYEGSFLPPKPGQYLLVVSDIRPPAGGRPASARIRVRLPAPEMRRIEADHDALERIASATGGRVVELDELEAEFGTIRERSVQIPDDVTEPLWDSKLAFMLFLFLICSEWVLRKACGLL